MTMLHEYIFSIIIYFVSFFLILSIFLPKRTFGLYEAIKSFLISTPLIIALSTINYFFIKIDLLPIIPLDLTQVKKFKFPAITLGYIT